MNRFWYRAKLEFYWSKGLILFLFSLPVVVTHEFGHFAAAKVFKKNVTVANFVNVQLSRKKIELKGHVKYMSGSNTPLVSSWFITFAGPGINVLIGTVFFIIGIIFSEFRVPILAFAVFQLHLGFRDFIPTDRNSDGTKLVGLLSLGEFGSSYWAFVTWLGQISCSVNKKSNNSIIRFRRENSIDQGMREQFQKTFHTLTTIYLVVVFWSRIASLVSLLLLVLGLGHFLGIL